MVGRIARLVVGLSLLAAAVSPASAATLPFTATLSVTFGTLPAATFSASGTAFTAGAGGALTLPGNLFIGTVTLPTSALTTPLFRALKLTLTGNAPGSFNPSIVLAQPHYYAGSGLYMGGTGYGLGFGGPMQLYAQAVGNVLSILTLTIPLSRVGAGSSAQNSSGTIGVTVLAEQWTIFSAWVAERVTGSWSVAMTGSDGRTASGAGPVTLVSPVKIITTGTGQPALAAFATVTVNFIPEPGTGLLLAAGVVLLARTGRRFRN